MSGTLPRTVNGRVVSTSPRCRNLIERALARPGYRGVTAYSLAEAPWPHATGASDGPLVAYPTADRVRAYRGEGQCFG